MEIRIFKPANHKIKTVIYGASGTGKTTFGATAPNPIFASAEDGLLSVADKEVPYVQIKSLKDLKELLNYLKTQKHDYQSVVIDSISEINDIIKAGIESSKGRAMQLQDWGTVAKEIENILRGFRNLPMHTIFIAQEQNIVDEEKIAKISPSLNGKSATKIAYFMDIVGYISINKKGERELRTSAHPKLLTKDRSKVIGDDTEMDFTVWAEKISGIEIGEEKILVKEEIEVPEEKKSFSEKVSEGKETDRKETFDKHKAILEKCGNMDELKKAWGDVSFDKGRLNEAYFKELKEIKDNQKFEIEKKEKAEDAKNNTQDEEGFADKKEDKIEDAEIVKEKTEGEILAEKSTKKLEKTLTKAEKEIMNEISVENIEKDYSKILQAAKNLDELKEIRLSIPKDNRDDNLSKVKDELKEKLSIPEKALEEEKPKKAEKKEFDDVALEKFSQVCKTYETFEEALKEIQKNYTITEEMKNKAEAHFVL